MDLMIISYYWLLNIISHLIAINNLNGEEITEHFMKKNCKR